ncbi:putative AC transposase [Fusarium oxysporum f. sp. cubense]|nr:putative AC transposase [Fusarium oxysporum f. sp. cubense]TVY74188.1 putative AC transposase [Fusarium oxysporum f. sp. cubense]TVY74943.1 putative AC transposase [Fusarium oxysporum f. sp. cubense]TVY75078.1 putative AC transposase [Fusarium oxysporum f. sp. cubense]TVY77619.1 putative AC transposase [Fusarium oxysporum f. sp. cubense]
MSGTAIKGSLAGSPSSSPPPPAFPRLGSRSKAIAKQYDAALTLASTADSSVDDLYKIIWGQRRFVIASLLDKRKSRGRRSWIGNHGWFLAELRKDNTSSGDIWCCRLCDNKGAPRFFNAQSTSSASAHLFKAHGITETFEAGSSGDSSVIDLQRNASKKRPASSSFLLPRAKMARIRELSVGYIVDSNLPFTTFESTYLQELFRQLDSDLYAQVPWGRTATKKDLEDILVSKKAAVKEELENAVTQIHLSFDLWTSPNRLAFISIFGHFIDRRHSYQSRLLAFKRQIGSHAGENIAYTIRNVVRDWGIDCKLGVSICDNAASNDVCLRNLYTSLDASITRADTEARRMRCFGHILNLVAQAFLYGDDAASFELQSEAYDMLERVEEDLEHWRAKGPVGKLHNIVKFIRASPQRTETFKAHAREQEEVDIYKLAEESTAELEVIQNNATRWNSTYMMIERALVKQSELNSFIQELGLEADASKRVPTADILTSDDWKVLREVSHILEPVYNMTMRTQGWGTSGGHGRLWEVMTGMEFILEHLEDWKVLYEDETADPAAEEWYTTQGEEARPAMGVTSTLSRPPTVGQIRERPSRQSRLPSRLQGYEITPLRRRRETTLPARPPASSQFNEDALPVHSREDYLQDDARSVSNIASMEGQERASIKASINNAWIKLNEYYTLLGRSPLFAASVVLNPDLGLRWLETNWTSPEQLQWLRDAKDGIKVYFERWYSKNDDNASESVFITPSLTPRPEQSRFEQWIKSRQPKLSATGSELERYYRLEPEQVDDPIRWWIDHSNAFPRLSRFALDILAIPAMSTDCERAFSLAKLTVSSQRHSLLGSSIESIQLLKNWVRGGCITLGGLCSSNKAD